jgi:hypothetical protein
MSCLDRGRAVYAQMEKKAAVVVPGTRPAAVCDKVARPALGPGAGVPGCPAYWEHSPGLAVGKAW